MDNKKLMQILLRDAAELEQFIGEIRQTACFDVLDMELLETRISGFRRLLELAYNSDGIPKESGVTERTASIPVATAGQALSKQEDRKPRVRKKETAAESIRKAPGLSSDVPVPEKEEIIKGPVHRMPAEQPVMSLEDEVSPVTGGSSLAEKFVAGKSLNDMLLEKSKPESSYADLPLNSLTSGIGTNERFLFTRELFGGNMEQFHETILKLDAMSTVQEAAEFLRENFKWKKNETSMRFIELVKRRFIK